MTFTYRKNAVPSVVKHFDRLTAATSVVMTFCHVGKRVCAVEVGVLKQKSNLHFCSQGIESLQSIE